MCDRACFSLGNFLSRFLDLRWRSASAVLSVAYLFVLVDVLF